MNKIISFLISILKYCMYEAISKDFNNFINLKIIKAKVIIMEVKSIYIFRLYITRKNSINIEIIFIKLI